MAVEYGDDVARGFRQGEGLMGRDALSTLIERCPTLSLVGDGERIKPFFLWGRKTLPVKVG
ncbi:MAG: hypothetical protein E2O92_06115 [Alphaproteobacteria bacterium]|nr:MAG: hypothetical protein E2O92_06115 [Alphaproteobacteria bacterium]